MAVLTKRLRQYLQTQSVGLFSVNDWLLAKLAIGRSSDLMKMLKPGCVCGKNSLKLFGLHVHNRVLYPTMG